MLSRPIIETFILEENENKNITLTAYVASAIDEMPYNYKRPAVIICPGGGYRFVSNREGEPVALAFLAAGVNAFVLNYSTTNDNEVGKLFPGQLLELASAMKLVKERSEDFHIDPDRIFVCGFSAGGHLAASLGTLHSSNIVKDALGVADNELRPKGMILAYPVISAGKYCHKLSFMMLLGDKTNDETARRSVSLEYQVDENTCPTFIWHTRTDTGVPVQNSLLFTTALAENGIPFEMHIYPEGPHGMSLATDVVGSPDPHVAEWFGAAVNWLKKL